MLTLAFLPHATPQCATLIWQRNTHRIDAAGKVLRSLRNRDRTRRHCFVCFFTKSVRFALFRVQITAFCI